MAEAREDLVLPALCKNAKCCGKFLCFGEREGGERALLPLIAVAIKAQIRGSMATTEFQLSYINPHKENPLECSYTFPSDKMTVLAKFEASIDDRVINTKVTEKQEAKETYENAIAGGNAAVFVEREKNDEVIAIRLGNLLPG